MIQDIYPSKFDNEFKNYEIRDEDFILIFDREGRVLVGKNDGCMEFNTGEYVKDKRTVYLFTIDEKRFFLLIDESDGFIKYQKKGFSYYSIREIRDQFSNCSNAKLLAVFTAYHLWRWYADNQFCGRCGNKLEPDRSERALRCPHCNNVIYPRINSAVIVGVTKGDSLLITRYRRGYKHNALVAGFTEIGETLEETVKREVMEETGVSVKNIRYYKSQPWGMAQDILMGFFCEAEEEAAIHMDEHELRYAEWVKKEDIKLQPNDLSLTNEMMRVFKEGQYK